MRAMPPCFGRASPAEPRRASARRHLHARVVCRVADRLAAASIGCVDARRPPGGRRRGRARATSEECRRRRAQRLTRVMVRIL
ncbi:Os02g0594750 [Oryza sativa Japonica Group]|uniref:Os02g0594750 protein n=1 Tax=Oryza sativa subsp. japonica TaxID=39947 RepID=A0A0P0VLC1_ORYSJ|nr:hypothetical protein EE612_012177 [Oryza sativa]BAS79540.1 Os02g0594750 [Oryza sativa Japonica Group]